MCVPSVPYVYHQCHVCLVSATCVPSKPCVYHWSHVCLISEGGDLFVGASPPAETLTSSILAFAMNFFTLCMLVRAALQAQLTNWNHKLYTVYTPISDQNLLRDACHLQVRRSFANFTAWAYGPPIAWCFLPCKIPSRH